MNSTTHYHTGHKSEIKDYVWNYKDQYLWNYRHFQYQTDVNQSLIERDSFLASIHSHLQGKLRFFKFPSMTFYRWHVDVGNLCNFNLIFLPQRAHTLFLDHQNTTHGSQQIHSVEEVKYVPGEWTLFNSQITHSVCNLDNDTRYLLTYSVEKYTYDEVLSFLKSLN
jgi:hypothetical protein